MRSTNRNGDDGPYLPIQDLELLHNFTTVTIPSLHTDLVRQKVWADDFVRLSFSKLYLLHAILALSALHLVSQDRSRTELLALASAHQTAALRLAQPHIAHLTEAESVAIFAFSGFTALSACVETSLEFQESDYSGDPIGAILSCFNLNRGIKLVLEPFREHFFHNTFVRPALTFEDRRGKVKVKT